MHLLQHGCLVWAVRSVSFLHLLYKRATLEWWTYPIHSTALPAI